MNNSSRSNNLFLTQQGLSEILKYVTNWNRIVIQLSRRNVFEEEGAVVVVRPVVTQMQDGGIQFLFTSSFFKQRLQT